MIAWKLITEFDKEKHLFSELITTNYFVIVYSCSCGYDEFIVSTSDQENEYVCSTCNNKVFYDANYAKKNIEYFLQENENLELDYKYELNILNNKIQSTYVTYVPSGIDFMKKQINYAPVTKYFLELHYDGTIKKNCEDSFDKIHLNMIKMINNHLDKNTKKLNLPNPGRKKMTIEKAAYFFKNRNIQDFELFFWEKTHIFYEEENLTVEKAFTDILNGRKERSIKKAVFENYHSQMKKTNRYDAALPEDFIFRIKDPNLLVKFLKLDIYDRRVLSAKLMSSFFILSEVYSHKQIYRLFSELSDGSERVAHLFEDLINDLLRIRNLKRVFEQIKKPKCTLMSLHDSLSNYDREMRKKEIIGRDLNSQKSNQKACVRIDGYEVKLPKTGDELYKWAKELNNCMASYFYSIEAGSTIIYCFFKNQRIEFAIEVRDEQIVQASSIGNKILGDIQKNVLKKWQKRFFHATKEYEFSVPVEIVYDE